MNCSCRPIFKIENDIAEERKNQNKKWGEQNHSPIEWIPILMEEVGEASKEALQYHFIQKDPVYRVGFGIEQAQSKDMLSRYREELVQCAAVCVSMIESLERNELKQPELF